VSSARLVRTAIAATLATATDAARTPITSLRMWLSSLRAW
jgi:hypothetical protein